MAHSSARFAGNLFLGMSLLIFAIFFLNVLMGGPLGHKPWMSDVAEMLTLFLAVIFFVAGALARETESKEATPKAPKGEAKLDSK